MTSYHDLIRGKYFKAMDVLVSDSDPMVRLSVAINVVKSQDL